jgi:hypothetical protein
MKKVLLIIFILSSLMIVPAHSYGSNILDNNEYIELVSAWKIFLKAVSMNDLQIIKDLSVDKIRCLSCLDNTEEKDKEIEKFKMTEPDWYKKLYEEKIFIPINKFCKEDYPIIFSKIFIQKLQNSETIYTVEHYNDENIYEVIVTTTKPGEIAPGHEGGQHAFQFIKKNNEYKFWGIDTIP